MMTHGKVVAALRLYEGANYIAQMHTHKKHVEVKRLLAKIARMKVCKDALTPTG